MNPRAKHLSKESPGTVGTAGFEKGAEERVAGLDRRCEVGGFHEVEELKALVREAEVGAGAEEEVEGRGVVGFERGEEGRRGGVELAREDTLFDLLEGGVCGEEESGDGWG